MKNLHRRSLGHHRSLGRRRPAEQGKMCSSQCNGEASPMLFFVNRPHFLLDILIQSRGWLGGDSNRRSRWL